MRPARERLRPCLANEKVACEKTIIIFSQGSGDAEFGVDPIVFVYKESNKQARDRCKRSFAFGVMAKIQKINNINK